MDYYIDYEKETGKILGFIIDETKKQGEVVEVTREVFEREMNTTNNNKIVINGDNITFSTFDFTTNEEKEEQRISSIKFKAQSLILEKYPLEKQSSANLGLYGQEYLDTMKAYILNIITVSNEAELNGTALEDINWNLEGGN